MFYLFSWHVSGNFQIYLLNRNQSSSLEIYFSFIWVFNNEFEQIWCICIIIFFDRYLHKNLQALHCTRINQKNLVKIKSPLKIGDMGSRRMESPNYRNPCLTMHQPWASLLVYGIKRIEGRSWPSPIRGKITFHSPRLFQTPFAFYLFFSFFFIFH